MEQSLSAFKCRFSIFYISLFCQSIVLLFWAQCFINVVDNISVNIYRGPYNNRGGGGNTLKISGNRWFLCGSCVTHYRQPWHQLFFLPCSTKNGLKNVTKYFQPYFFLFSKCYTSCHKRQINVIYNQFRTFFTLPSLLASTNTRE